jgi:GR25 family glycosyltransferase involved in LPS biosynthesis
MLGQSSNIKGGKVRPESSEHHALSGCKVMKPADGWDFFDRIYCISVEERTDRRQAATRQFDKVGLAGRVEFVIVKRHPRDVEQGMYESHMACLRKGLEAGAERIVVFEDDVLYDRFDAGRFSQCTRFLSDHPDWQVLLLGGLIRSSKKTTNPCMQKVRYQSLAHAYALNRPYAETLAYTPWQGIVIDTLFRPLTDHMYAVYPMFAFQNNLPSDNEKYPYLELFRRCCGGLERIQKLNEFYHRHTFGIIASHALIFLFLLSYLLTQ